MKCHFYDLLVHSPQVQSKLYLENIPCRYLIFLASFGKFYCSTLHTLKMSSNLPCTVVHCAVLLHDYPFIHLYSIEQQLL